ncbi:MAG: hypothetical protein ACRDSG_06750 [Pseudonocardiaceae bacterium]
MATRRRPTSQERLAKQVLDILVGCGLNHTGTSLVGGQNFYFPQVVEVVDFPYGVEVVDGPTNGLIIRILPGQAPQHFANHARTIAYNLELDKVEVVPLGPYLIRLNLWPTRNPRRSLAPPPLDRHRRWRRSRI